MQSIGMIKTVLIIATGKETRKRSLAESLSDWESPLYSFILFLKISELARKEAHERPCLISKGTKPVYKSKNFLFCLK